MRVPNVLCCSGHDPTGGAGIQADIEAVAAQGAHALTLVTALTAQDTHNVQRVDAMPPEWLAQQGQLLLADCAIAAIKIGLLGVPAQLSVLVAFIRQSQRPVVLDPILRAGGGTELVGNELAVQMRQQLFPLCTVLTPNAAEARRWTGERDLDTAGQALLADGAQHVLITGGDEPGEISRNRWYTNGAPVRVFERARLPGHFHGAGCTLAAALAARLALGESVEAALIAAQAYVHETLRHARPIGGGRWLPRRLLPGGMP